MKCIGRCAAGGAHVEDLVVQAFEAAVGQFEVQIIPLGLIVTTSRSLSNAAQLRNIASWHYLEYLIPMNLDAREMRPTFPIGVA